MPGILKVKIIAAKELPVMDRASDLTDAFVEVRLGSINHRTEVCRKSLNPVWNSEWFKFEADDEELQDEPLQIKVLDYDMYSTHDAIGKVTVGLSPLLLKNGTSEMGGWFPIYDTLHGIRGYLHIKVKVEFFVDTNKYRQTSCGIQFFSTSGVPTGFTAISMQGFVEILIVNDDPEYQWIEKIRSPRASNEARLRLFSKLSGEVHRKLGLKVIDAGGNAVIGFRQYFDIEGDTGIVVRGIGTSVTLAKYEDTNSDNDSAPNSADVSYSSGAVNPMFPSRAVFEKQQELVLSQSAKKRTMSSRGNRTISSSSDGVENLNELSALMSVNGESPESAGIFNKEYFTRTQITGMRQKLIEELEFPFFTITRPPSGFILHIGGVVSSMSVKLLDKINNPDEPETREAWWVELRTEVRSHAKALGCHAVVGYTEWTNICDDLMILCASGTAAIVRLPDQSLDRWIDHQETEGKRTRELKTSVTEEDEDDEAKDEVTSLVSNEDTLTIKQRAARLDGFDCRVCHIPFVEVDLPFAMNISRCMICKHGKVPDVIFATIEPPPDAAITGTGCLLQARVCRAKKREKDEAHAENVSQILPFLEYELHRQLLSKLKIKSMNAIFGIKMQVTVGEQVIIGVMTGTAVFLSALATPPLFIVSSSKNDSSQDDKKLMEIQKKIIDETTKNRARMNLCENLEIFTTQAPPNTPIFSMGGLTTDTGVVIPERADVQGQLDLAFGVKETYVVTVDDNIDDNIISSLIETHHVEGGHTFNTEATPGSFHDSSHESQFFTLFHRRKMADDDLRNANVLTRICEELIRGIHFKMRRSKPYSLSKLTFDFEIPEDNNLQITLTASALKSGIQRKARKSTRSSALKVEEEDVFTIEVPDSISSNDGQVSTSTVADKKTGEEHVLSRTWPSCLLSQVKSINYNVTAQKPEVKKDEVVITAMSDVPQRCVEQYLGHLNLFFIRESTSVKEDGGLNMFMQTFFAEVLAVVRAHVTAFHGDAIVAFGITEIILFDSPHKNQGQCLLNVCGDAVKLSSRSDYDEDSSGLTASHFYHKRPLSMSSGNSA